jgi:hypothetical protein
MAAIDIAPASASLTQALKMSQRNYARGEGVYYRASAKTESAAARPS